MSRANSAQAMGLQRFLDKSKAKHNGFGYTHFCIMAAVYKNGRASLRSMAGFFNVHDATMAKWLLIHDLENKTNML